IDLDGSTSSGGRLESKLAFQLAPGTYVLSFKLGSSSPNNTARVTLGSVFDETFTRPGDSPFETVSRTFTVTEPTSGRLVFDQFGGDNGGLIIDDVSLSANGRIDLQAGSLSGSGTIDGDVASAGKVEPGLLTIGGSYTQSAAGTLEIRIAGATAGSQYGRLESAGAASLAGALKVRLDDGFRPLAGDVFQIATFASRLGEHTTLEGLNLGERQSLRATYGAQALLLTGIMAGIRIDPPAGLVTSEEGWTDQLTVALATRPAADVTLSLSSSDATEGSVSPPSLTFTPSDWDTARTVVVTGVDDEVVDGNVPYAVVFAPAASADPDYDGLDADDVSVLNRDDDTLDLRVDNLRVEPATGLRSGSSLTVLWEVANSGNTASTAAF